MQQFIRIPPKLSDCSILIANYCLMSVRKERVLKAQSIIVVNLLIHLRECLINTQWY